MPNSEIVITADGRASRVMLLGDSTQETKITLSPPPTVRGRVIDADNLGVRDVIVRVGTRSTPGLFDARTDADGNFIVDDLPADLDLVKDPRARQVTISHPAFGYRVKTVDRFPAEVDFKIDLRVDVSRRKKIIAVSQYGDHEHPQQGSNL